MYARQASPPLVSIFTANADVRDGARGNACGLGRKRTGSGAAAGGGCCVVGGDVSHGCLLRHAVPPAGVLCGLRGVVSTITKRPVRLQAPKAEHPQHGAPEPFTARRS